MLLIDSNQHFGRSLQDYVETLPNVELVECARDFAAALDLLEVHKPDLVLVDAWYQSDSPGQLLEQIRNRHESATVCLLSLFEEPLYAQHAITHGYDGAISRLGFEHEFLLLVETLFPDGVDRR